MTVTLQLVLMNVTIFWYECDHLLVLKYYKLVETISMIWILTDFSHALVLQDQNISSLQVSSQFLITKLTQKTIPFILFHFIMCGVGCGSPSLSLSPPALCVYLFCGGGGLRKELAGFGSGGYTKVGHCTETLITRFSIELSCLFVSANLAGNLNSQLLFCFFFERLQVF